MGANLVTLTGNGTNSVAISPVSTTANGSMTLNVSYGSDACGSVSISKTIWVGTYRASINNATTSSGDHPSLITATANNSYIQFTISTPSESNAPILTDWQFEKISGNFFFNGATGYNATTQTGKVAFVYLTGANPTDNPLKFKARVKTDCGWGSWTEFIWNDGTTTPLPPPAAVKYFTVSPNPGTYYVQINLINPGNPPPYSPLPNYYGPVPPVTAALYYMNGSLCSNPITLTNFSGTMPYISYGSYGSTLPSGTYIVKITYSNFSETHTVIKI